MFLVNFYHRHAKHHNAGEHELELIQTQMTQKPVLRAKMYARALRASRTAPSEAHEVAYESRKGFSNNKSCSIGLEIGLLEQY